MHDGCSGNYNSGVEVAEKVRAMGFSDQLMPMALDIKCHGCGKELLMETFETKCPECGMVHAVTPCHAFDPENIKPAGINY